MVANFDGYSPNSAASNKSADEWRLQATWRPGTLPGHRSALALLFFGGSVFWPTKDALLSLGFPYMAIDLCTTAAAAGAVLLLPLLLSPLTTHLPKKRRLAERKMERTPSV